MNSELMALTKFDNDYTYSGVQAKLRRFENVMNAAADILATGRSRMRLNSNKILVMSGLIHNVDVETLFVGMALEAGESLGTTDQDMSSLATYVREMADEARSIRLQHAQMYGPLDEVRAGRRIKTPKPSFFDD